MQDLNARARRGIRLLLLRQGVLQLLALGGGIVVARRLGPGPLGVFGIVVFVAAVGGLLAEFGLKAALVRRAEPVTDRELVTSVTLRHILVTLVTGALLVGAPSLATLYPRVPPDLAWLLRLIAVDLYFRAWRATSEVQLERALRFEALAFADVVATVGYQIVSVGLVLAGWGAEGLVWGVLVGSLLRVVLLYRASPWPIRFALDPGVARELLRVGGSVQASQLISHAPAWVTPTLVAGLVGPEAVGLLTWAAWIGRKPLEVLESVVRVSVSHFARLQDDVAEMEHVLGRYVVASLLACGLWVAILCVAGEDLVRLIYSERWVPAVPALLVFAVATMLATVRWIASSALIGLGRIRFTAQVMTLTSILAVASSVVLVLGLGVLGVPTGQLVGMAVSAPWLLAGLSPGTSARVLRQASSVLIPMGTSMAAGAVTTLLPVAPVARGVITAGVVSVVYACVAWRVGPDWLRAIVRQELQPAGPGGLVGACVAGWRQTENRLRSAYLRSLPAPVLAVVDPPLRRVAATTRKAAAMPLYLRQRVAVCTGACADGPARIALWGKPASRRALFELLFDGAAVIEWRETRLLPGILHGAPALDADLLVAETTPALAPAFRRRGWLVVPNQVRFGADISTLRAVAARPSKSLRSDLQLLARAGYRREVRRYTTALGRRAFDDYIVPHARARFGATALASAFPWFDVQSCPGHVLAVFAPSAREPDAVAIIIPRGRVLEFKSLGTRNGDPAIARAGGIHALYEGAIAFASEHGFAAVDAGRCRPWRRDGVATYKWKRGFRPIPDGAQTLEYAIRVLRPESAAAHRLSEAGVLVRTGAGFRVLGPDGALTEA